MTIHFQRYKELNPSNGFLTPNREDADRVLLPAHVSEMRVWLSIQTVKALKALCSSRCISSVWYNKATKHELVEKLMADAEAASKDPAGTVFRAYAIRCWVRKINERPFDFKTLRNNTVPSFLNDGGWNSLPEPGKAASGGEPTTAKRYTYICEMPDCTTRFESEVGPSEYRRCDPSKRGKIMCPSCFAKQYAIVLDGKDQYTGHSYEWICERRNSPLLPTEDCIHGYNSTRFDSFTDDLEIGRRLGGGGVLCGQCQAEHLEKLGVLRAVEAALGIGDPLMAADPVTLTTKEPTPMSSAPQTAPGVLDAMFGDLVTRSVSEVLAKNGIDKDMVLRMVREAVHGIAVPVTVHVATPSGTAVIEGAHCQVPRLMFWLGLRKHIYLYGPAGSGKSYAVRQVASAIGREYFYFGCSEDTSAPDIVGYNWGKEYVETAFIAAVQQENTIILVDEFDRAPGSVTVILNALLSGEREISTPGGMITVPETVSVVLTGNTRLSGADVLYTAGQRQDASTINRLITIPWDYDPALEEKLAVQHSKMWGGEATTAMRWLNYIRNLRAKAKELSMTYVIGPRQIIAGAEALAVTKGKDGALIADEVVFGAFDPEDVRRLKAAVKLEV